MGNSEDIKLVQESLKGDKKSFSVLLRKYELPMYRTALGIVNDSELAKDVVQNGFIKAWEKLHTFNPRYKFYSWLYKTIVNESLNTLRSSNIFEKFSTQESSIDNPYQELMKKEENKTLLDAIDNLPSDYKLIIQLRHFEDMSYKELAEILEIEEKTVKSRLYSARLLLRKKVFNK